MLTEADWDRLYVVVSVIWPLTRESAHEPARQILHEARAAGNQTWSCPRRHDAGAGPDPDGPHRRRPHLAPLVFDKAQGREFAEDIYSLSTQRDLMSQVIRRRWSLPRPALVNRRGWGMPHPRRRVLPALVLLGLAMRQPCVCRAAIAVALDLDDGEWCSRRSSMAAVSTASPAKVWSS